MLIGFRTNRRAQEAIEKTRFLINPPSIS